MHGQSSLNLDVNQFRSAVACHAQDWAVTDRALYELCRQQPGHAALSAVNAKALLIGRGFATGLAGLFGHPCCRADSDGSHGGVLFVMAGG